MITLDRSYKSIDIERAELIVFYFTLYVVDFKILQIKFRKN